MRRKPPASTWRRPAKKYSQAHRVLSIYDRLHAGERLRADEVAPDFDVSNRTIERDIAVLRTVLGGRIDAREEGGRGLVYFIPHDKKRRDITPWQILAVAVGTRLTGFLSGQRFVTEVKPLLDQLRNSLKPGERFRLQKLERKIHVVGSGQKDYRRNPEAQKRLRHLLDGLQKERPVSIGYLSHKRRQRGEGPLELLVHPLCLVIHRGGVYFVVDIADGGWNTDTTRILIALDRIVEARCHEETNSFEYPKDFSPEEFFAGAFGIFADSDKNTKGVKLKICPIYAPYVQERHWHQSQVMTQRRDGSLLVEFQLTNVNELSDWILGMGEHAEVLAPKMLRDEVRSRLERALGQYA